MGFFSPRQAKRLAALHPGPAVQCLLAGEELRERRCTASSWPLGTGSYLCSVVHLTRSLGPSVTGPVPSSGDKHNRWTRPCSQGLCILVFLTSWQRRLALFVLSPQALTTKFCLFPFFFSCCKDNTTMLKENVKLIPNPIVYTSLLVLYSSKLPIFLPHLPSDHCWRLHDVP